MATTTQIKEEFYVRRLFDDDVPVFVDATRFARQELPYPLSAKKSLKATCGVRTDDEVVAFSLRNYTGRQAEKEVENVEHRDAVTGKATATNLLRPRMPRKTLHALTETARTLADRLGDSDTVIAELDGTLHTFKVERAPGGTRLQPQAEEDTSFELPVVGVRLRIFLRSPIRERVLAYAFSGYLTRKPGEQETVVRAVSLALNSILGLATFRMLSGLDRVDVPPPGAAGAAKPAQKVAFTVPVLLFTAEAVPAARGTVGAEIGLDRVDPVSGGLQLAIADATGLEWNPAVSGITFEVFEKLVTETISTMVHAALGAEPARDIAYDVMLGDVTPASVTALRTATAGLPGVAATPTTAEVRQLQPAG